MRGGVTAHTPRAAVDWLNATFPEPGMAVADIADVVRNATGNLPITLRRTPGMLGFGQRHLISRAGGSSVLASICVGGESQAQRWMLQLTGKGCALVKDWPLIRDFLRASSATITRLDLKVDFPNGEKSMEDVLSMLDHGGFTVQGRKPTSTVAGDWRAGERGRTLYVGKPGNGKALRAYEKGKQLGDLTSPWVRIEVQFGSRGRIIPPDALTDPDPYFAGAYPALATLLPVAALSIRATKKAAVTDLARKLFHLRLSYGAALTEALATAGADEKILVDALRTPASSSGVGDAQLRLSWDEIKADLTHRILSRPTRDSGSAG